MSIKIKAILIIAFATVLFLGYAFFFMQPSTGEKVTWGVNFSQRHAEDLGLNSREVYMALLEDLRVGHVKLITYWNMIEPERGRYYFDDVDWQVSQAEKYNAKVIYVVGMKTGRWPECHIPEWAKNLNKEEQQEEILRYIEDTILRYRDSNAIIYWQAENEPLFPFGECPWSDKDFLKKEVELIKSLDPSRPVIVSDTGEYSLWLSVARIGDVVGTTMYRSVWVKIFGDYGFYFGLGYPSQLYLLRSQLIKNIFGKNVINVELQAEPWTRKGFLNTSLEEQEKTMNLEQFKKNINFAKKTGLGTFYFWGAEWWYWMKEKHNQPEIWEEAKKLFVN